MSIAPREPEEESEDTDSIGRFGWRDGDVVPLERDEMIDMPEDHRPVYED